ncbi:response regulator [Pseudanabaena biceps]|nr:response regulator [Pseudanabaena biceps]
MKTLSAEVLHEIAIETRQCFLSEDAPLYLTNLKQGLAQIQAGQPDYILLMHAAHSLKGGAGIAELLSLSKLAHKLEDMLEVLQHHEFGDRATIAEIISHGIDEVDSVLSQAIALSTNSLVDIQVDPELLQRLDAVLDIINQPQDKAPIETSATKPEDITSPLVRSSLEKDLEACIKQIETQLSPNPSLLSESKIREELQYFCDECLLLGDTLNLEWLINTVEPFELRLQQKPEVAILLTEVQVIINSLRSQRSQYLHLNLAAELPMVLNAVPVESIELTSESISYLRIPSTQIETMTSTVAEMIVRHERLLTQQQQLGQTNKNLQALVSQMIPLQEQVQTIYNQLTTNVNGPKQDHQPNADDLAVNDDFDQLELDQYSSSHTTLQNLQEVLMRVRESRSDIDLSCRDLGEEIEYLRQDLDRLYAQLAQSRLVPFKNLASRFLPQLKRLCQRHNKKVQLVIQGENILIDQIILEQLQTPLNHLLINAFDHGVESPESRLMLGKPETATLTLSAVVSGSQVIISLKDDGDGINLNKIYQKAIEKNILPANIPIDKISHQKILNFIFHSNFSTRDIVTEMSGRGMGLDIVRSHINRLRGNIQVETLQGHGTTFTIRLPLGLSLVNLLICVIGENLIAIIANDVLDIFAYTEAEINNTNNNFYEVNWRKQSIPLLHLNQALQYSNSQTNLVASAKVCLVLNRNNTPIAVTVNGIIEERKLILKPFDQSVAVPSYFIGCTVLGNGQVVSVLTPDNLHILLSKNIQKSSKIIYQTNNQKTIKTILIAEDSIATRNMLERMLKQLDFEVVACRDGQEAIEMLNRTPDKVCMVISDIEMPKVNGFDLLQTIRAHDSWFDLPVVMLTSRTGERHRQRAASLGANGYLSKPIVVGELIECLGEFIK